MNSARNNPSPQEGLHSGATADRDSPPWHRVRRVLDGYPTAIIQLISESYGKDSLQHAWREFTIGAGNTPFLGNDPNAELFFSWLFHRWSPDLQETLKITDETCYGIPPTQAYLSRNASTLDPLQRRYLKACLTAPLSFYEILDCKPHVGFKARNLLAGNELDVSESLASTTLQNADIVFAHIVPLDGMALMEAIAPVSFPPTLKRPLTELRLRRNWTGRADLPLRRLYFNLLESHRGPPSPEVRSTDAEVLDVRVTQH